MRTLLDAALYLFLWSIAISVIAGIVTLAHANFLAGMAAFVAYFVAAHFAFRWMGYKRGIFDVP